jgi:hypothetical protein
MKSFVSIARGKTHHDSMGFQIGARTGSFVSKVVTSRYLKDGFSNTLLSDRSPFSDHAM